MLARRLYSTLATRAISVGLLASPSRREAMMITSSMVIPLALMAARMEVSTRLSALKVFSSLRTTVSAELLV